MAMARFLDGEDSDRQAASRRYGNAGASSGVRPRGNAVAVDGAIAGDRRHTIFTVHLAAYGENPRPCQLLEDDGVTLDYEKGNWATLTVRADGTIQCPNHGQSQRYRTVGTAKAPQALLEHLLTTQ